MVQSFSIFKPYQEKLTFGTTLKELGSFDDQRKLFGEQVKKLPSEQIIFSNQVHGDEIHVFVDKPVRKPEGDAFITQKKGLGLAVKVADCQGILLFDPRTSTIAAIHAGWKGVAKEIIPKTIEVLQNCFKTDPSDLLAGISPSLGPCCSEFSDPEKELPKFMHTYINDKYVDLWKTVDDQLSKAGIPDKNIERIKECTKCGREKYFSHRNKDKERMAVFIELK